MKKTLIFLGVFATCLVARHHFTSNNLVATLPAKAVMATNQQSRSFHRLPVVVVRQAPVAQDANWVSVQFTGTIQ